MFQWLDLGWTTSGGSKIAVVNWDEWVIYNEVFVDGSYDAAIDAALRSDGPLRVLDLGANVGFFVLRLHERLRASDASRACSTLAVEANPAIAAVLSDRLADNGLSDRVTVCCAVAGGGPGSQQLYVSPTAPGHSSILRRPGGDPITVTSIDLDHLTASMPSIDLLKCDVEGAELGTFEKHPAMLAKTRVLVCELHHRLCDTARCLSLLAAAGLSRQIARRDNGDYSTVTLGRQPSGPVLGRRQDD